MKAQSVRAIIVALNEAQVRYLIVGGLAVVAHGYVRYTVDVDLVVALDLENVRRAIDALHTLEYRPRAPVPLEGFADSGTRETWIREKGLVVFQLVSDLHPETAIDIFASLPFDFETEFERAARVSILGGSQAAVVALDELLAMKVRTGRAKDLIDVEELRKIRQLP